MRTPHRQLPIVLMDLINTSHGRESVRKDIVLIPRKLRFAFLVKTRCLTERTKEVDPLVQLGIAGTDKFIFLGEKSHNYLYSY